MTFTDIIVGIATGAIVALAAIVIGIFLRFCAKNDRKRNSGKK